MGINTMETPQLKKKYNLRSMLFPGRDITIEADRMEVIDHSFRFYNKVKAEGGNELEYWKLLSVYPFYTTAIVLIE